MPQSRKSTDDNGAPDAPAAGGGHGPLEVPEGWASVLFDKAFALAEEYSAIVRARKANREALRSLAAQNLLSNDEQDLLRELYPERGGAERTAEERAAEMEQRAAEIRRKAQEAAGTAPAAA